LRGGRGDAGVQGEAGALGDLQPRRVRRGRQRLQREHLLALARPRCNPGPTEGAHALLDTLSASGIPTGIITNGFSFLQKRKAEAHGLAERVRFVLTSEDAGAHKPDARIFARALATVGVAARDAWHVGDHRDNDIAGALNAGLGAVWYVPESTSAGGPPADAALEPRPFRVITRLDELPVLFESRAGR